ncbi:hypothetical protein JOE11_000002 [Robbsia andropogonis]|uniref:hypothetical protein n=1 Tax=Robbsia andropogonis TaxID=28092 RepID=UPI003D1F14F5
MRPCLIFMLMAMAVVFTRSADANETYDGYDAFYATRPGKLFGEPVPTPTPGVVYSYKGEAGIHTSRQFMLEGKTVTVELSDDHITVNGKVYRFGHAVAFSGEHPSAIDPQSTDLFVVARTNNHPAVFCVEGSSDGSGEADRYKQIYMLVDPLKSKGRATFLHLPSLLSSCRAVSIAKDEKIIFPRNTYLLDKDQESRIGLLVSYYMFDGRRFMSAHDEVRLQFNHPEIPFQFSIQNSK